MQHAVQSAHASAWLFVVDKSAGGSRALRMLVSSWLVMLCSGCSLWSLDSIVATCQGSGCQDAGFVDIDAAPQDTCMTPVGADCNAAAACGCPDGERCALDETLRRVHCVSTTPGTGVEGSACSISDDCATGLTCNRSKLCARYCQEDADCSGQGKCVSWRDPTTRTQVAGSESCSRWCDPLTGTECLPLTGCFASVMTSIDPHAACGAIDLTAQVNAGAMGALCKGYDQCAAKLSCAEFGPTVCTPFCRRDSDCPADAPHCYLNGGLIEAPNTPIGQCVIWPCNEAVLPAPPTWQESPIWIQADYMLCQAACGDLGSEDCVRRHCKRGSEWLDCLGVAMRACAGAPGGPCRSEYAAATCCAVGACDQRPLENCEKQSTCRSQAEEVCLANSQN